MPSDEYYKEDSKKKANNKKASKSGWLPNKSATIWYRKLNPVGKWKIKMWARAFCYICTSLTWTCAKLLERLTFWGAAKNVNLLFSKQLAAECCSSSIITIIAKRLFYQLFCICSQKFSIFCAIMRFLCCSYPLLLMSVFATTNYNCQYYAYARTSQRVFRIKYLAHKHSSILQGIINSIWAD